MMQNAAASLASIADALLSLNSVYVLTGLVLYLIFKRKDWL